MEGKILPVTTMSQYISRISVNDYEIHSCMQSNQWYSWQKLMN